MNATATRTTGDKMTAKAMYELARARRNSYWHQATATSADHSDAELDRLLYMFERWNTIASRYVTAVRSSRMPRRTRTGNR